MEELILFLYIDPLKQGLKQPDGTKRLVPVLVFIHRSIKTRIETAPLAEVTVTPVKVFIHRSIKTRIETTKEIKLVALANIVFIHRSIKTRIETLFQVQAGIW